jgi:hypothetical protein
LGQKFAAALKSNAAMNAEYKALKTPGKTFQQKETFRLRWAARELDAITVVKNKLEEWQKVEEEWGTYECLENIVIAEGGKDSLAAWRAAIKYARKAMALGGQWLSYNSFTERTDILYVKKRNISRYTKAWSLFETSKTSGPPTGQLEAAASVAAASGASAIADETPLKLPRGKAAGKVAAKAASKAASRKRIPGESEASPDAKKATLDPESKHNSKLMRMADVLKNNYNKVSTMQTTMVRALNTDPAWSSLASEHNKDTLAKLHEPVVTCASDSFAKLFFSQDSATLKRSFKDDMSSFWHKLRILHDKMSEAVQDLDAAHSRLNKMFLAGK